MSDSTFIAGNYYNTNITAEQNSQFTQVFSAITQRMATAMSQGHAPDSDEMQSAVQSHYEFILQFWTPDQATYKSLAMNYVLPTEFKEHYDGVAAGLGQYIYAGVCVYADRNL